MEILFKCDFYIYYKNDTSLYKRYYKNDSGDLSNITHIENCPQICSIIDNSGREYEVYYFLNKENIITKVSDGFFTITGLFDDDTIDYTKVNINKLLNGNIM